MFISSVCVSSFMMRGEGAFDSGELADAVARSRRCQIYYSRLFYEDFTVDMISI